MAALRLDLPSPISYNTRTETDTMYQLPENLGETRNVEYSVVCSTGAEHALFLPICAF